MGYENPNTETSLLLIKYLDAYVGVPSVLIDHDTKRRSLYGKAGAFRLTDYGCEYRTLSSVFLKTKTNLEFVWESVQRALNAFNFGIPLPSSEDVQNAINNSDVDLARKLIKNYSLNDVKNPLEEFKAKINRRKIVRNHNVNIPLGEILGNPFGDLRNEDIKVNEVADNQAQIDIVHNEEAEIGVVKD